MEDCQYSTKDLPAALTFLANVLCSLNNVNAVQTKRAKLSLCVSCFSLSTTREALDQERIQIETEHSPLDGETCVFGIKY